MLFMTLAPDDAAGRMAALRCATSSRILSKTRIHFPFSDVAMGIVLVQLPTIEAACVCHTKIRVWVEEGHYFTLKSSNGCVGAIRKSPESERKQEGLLSGLSTECGRLGVKAPVAPWKISQGSLNETQSRSKWEELDASLHQIGPNWKSLCSLAFCQLDTS